MKVGNACKIMSSTVARALHEYSTIYEKAPEQGLDPKEALPLARVVQAANNWFDLFNSKLGKNGFKSPFIGKYVAHILSLYILTEFI